MLRKLISSSVLVAVSAYAGALAMQKLDKLEVRPEPIEYDLVKVAPTKFEGVQFVSNYDADTVLVNIPGVPNIFGYHIRVRLAGIDSAEISSKDSCERKVAEIAKDVVTKVVTTAKAIDLLEVKRDKFFRLVAQVSLTFDDGRKVDLSSLLLEIGAAVPYRGDAKPKTDWCPKISVLSTAK